MSNIPLHIDQTVASPSSEHSVYFDAPIMHFFTRKTSSAVKDVSVDPPSLSDADDNVVNSEGTGYTINRLSAAIPRDPIVRAHSGRGKDIYDLADSMKTSESHYTMPSKLDAAPLPDNVPSDSGYESSSVPRPAPVKTETMKSIPVVWNETLADTQPTPAAETQGDHEPKRSMSMKSLRSAVDRESGDNSTIQTLPDGGHSNSVRRRRVSLTGGTFESGAGTVGPAATLPPEVDDSFYLRTASAHAGLNKKEKAKILKGEAKEGKRVAKVIRSEAKAESHALEVAIQELADIQQMQKDAVKEESQANTAHVRAQRIFHKEELEYFSARAKYERAQADLNAVEDSRNASRHHAHETTEMLQEKNKEVEWLRAQKGADDRERQAKLRWLSGKV